jgi:branched-chain amino acid transport system permease protein
MLKRILSGDMPRSRVLNVLLPAILIFLVLTPFIFHGARAINVAATICVFIVLVASYDLLLGYTGIISFAHTMFYGIGAYSVGITMYRMNGTWGSVFLGLAIGMGVSFILALLIGFFSLRVKALFYAMITLAVAFAFAILTSQLSDWTGGDDGLSVPVPHLLKPSFKLLDSPVFGVDINGKLITYYLVLVVALLAFLFMLRIVNSPFGKVLQSIRENEFRSEAIGYKTVIYRTISNCLGALGATLAGGLLVLWVGYVGPDSTLSFTIMLNILLIVFIGGMATMYGAVVGSVIFIIAQNYLQDFMKWGSSGLIQFASSHSDSAVGSVIEFASRLIHPDRWFMWLGILFILSVYYFPLGIVGKLRSVKKR